MANILVVDDEIGIRELLSDILTDEGYSVDTAENAHCAREKIKEKVFDLILLDIWMPDTDGVTLLKEWKLDKHFTSQVIMMSGHATIETAIEATKFGSLTFLEKPISMQKLLETVHHGVKVQERVTHFAKCRPEAKPKEVSTPAISQNTTPFNSDRLPVFSVPGTDIVLDFNLTLREVREATERAYLLTLIHHEDNQIARVAQRAGLERTHLYRKLKALLVELPRSNKTSATTAKSKGKN